MTIDARHVGQRVVVRYRLVGQTGPSGGPALSDVVGVLRSYDGVTAEVTRRDGTTVSVEVPDIMTAKTIPEEPPGPRIDAERLQRICADGWPAVVTEPLGGWLLRAAGGFTGRANSALVAGDPGQPVASALEGVMSFYRAHDLPPLAQVVVGSRWERALTEHGWRPNDTRPGALVMVTTPTRQPRGRDAVQLRGDLDDAWLAVYGRSSGRDREVVRAVLEGPQQVVFARIGDPPVAIGRAVVTGRWAGVSAVEVMPERRQRGLGQAVSSALLGWAAGRGARWCHLQVSPDNDAALGLWRRFGFREHHAYRYLRP